MGVQSGPLSMIGSKSRGIRARREKEQSAQILLKLNIYYWYVWALNLKAIWCDNVCVVKCHFLLYIIWPVIRSPLSWTELVSRMNNRLRVRVCACACLIVQQREVKPKSMWLIQVNCCPLVSVRQLSLLCWFTRFRAPPLCPGDESPTSMERQIQSPDASQLHTSSPDTAKKKKQNKVTYTNCPCYPTSPPVAFGEY